MAERKGPDGEWHGRDSIESELHQDRSTNGDERDSKPVSEPADEGTELIDKNREAGSGESKAPQDETDTASGAAVLAFRQRDAADDEISGMDDEFDDDPIDLTALQDDDALLDALGGTNPDVSALGSDGPSVEELLVAWRQDVDAAPIGDLVDVDTAATAIAEGNRPRRGLRRRHLVPVATAAAVLMITFTGVGVAARDAQPGDMLWGVAKVLYTDQTRAVQAASDVKEELAAAQSAVEDGRLTAAEQALRSAKEQMRNVDDAHGLSELKAAHASLAKRVDEGERVPSSSSSATPSTSAQVPPAPASPSQPLPPGPPSSGTVPPSSTTGSSNPTTSPSETSTSQTSSNGWSFFPQNGSSSQPTTTRQ